MHPGSGLEGSAPVEVRLDTWRQRLRLVAGLVTVFGIAAAFVYAALVTADTTAKQVGAGIVAALFGVLGIALAYGGLFAVRTQALVFSVDGIARRAARQSWQIAWSELSRVEVHRSWSRTRSAFPIRLKQWRVDIRLTPIDADAFVAAHPALAVYRGFRGTPKTEFSVWLGPAKELAEPLDAALRAHDGSVYAGFTDSGDRQP